MCHIVIVASHFSQYHHSVARDDFEQITRTQESELFEQYNYFRKLNSLKMSFYIKR
jgi:hypothetical protein